MDEAIALQGDASMFLGGRAAELFAGVAADAVADVVEKSKNVTDFQASKGF